MAKKKKVEIKPSEERQKIDFSDIAEVFDDALKEKVRRTDDDDKKRKEYLDALRGK